MSDHTFRDWQHASRLVRTNNYEHGPKVKFLYHVYFYLSSPAKNMLPSLSNNINVVGMLVKSAELPKFSASMQTLNCYNRKKNVQTQLEYKPVVFTLHDDNSGITRDLLEGYYKYYFADGNHMWNSGAYGNGSRGDNMYKGAQSNSYNFGLDNNPEISPYFEKIEVSQLSRGEYFMYTLINPKLLDWSHDTMNYSEGGGINENAITIGYEGVNYSQGTVGDQNPPGFGDPDHYDTWS